MTVRHDIVDALGGKCVVCGRTDKNILHIDHIYGQGYLEKEWFSSKNEMLFWYYQFSKYEYPYLQVLCMNCNLTKRIENEEGKGRPSLKEFEQFYFVVDKKISTFEEKNEYFNKKIDEKKNFLEKYPQFIPLDRRLSLYYDETREMISEIDSACGYAKMARWWLPKRYADVIEEECKEHNIDEKVKQLMNKEKIPKDWDK